MASTTTARPPRRTETRAELVAMVEAAERVIPESADKINNLLLEVRDLKAQAEVWRAAHTAALQTIIDRLERYR